MFNPNEYPGGSQGGGAMPHRQGLVNLTCDLDHIAAANHQQNAAMGKGVFRRSGPDEFDIRADEPVVTPANLPMDNDDNKTVLVLSSLSGAHPDIHDEGMRKGVSNAEMRRRLMSRFSFVGFAMRAIHFKQDVGGYDPKASHLAVQLSGIVPQQANVDLPFGALARLSPPAEQNRTANWGRPDGIAPGKARLDISPDTSGRPFAMRMVHAFAENLYGGGSEMPVGPASSPADLAFDNMVEKLRQFMFMSYVLIGRARNIGANGDVAGADHVAMAEARAVGLIPGVDDLTRVVQNADMLVRDYDRIGSNEAKTEAIRKAYLSAAFMAPRAQDTANRNLVPNITEAIANSTIAPSPEGELLSLGLNHHLEFMSAMADALRFDNMWLVGKVVQPVKKGRTASVLVG